MPNATKSLIVSLHDTHPGSWKDISEQLDFLQNLGIGRCSILLVPAFHHEHGPCCWNEELCSALSARQDAGYDLVLHGYSHDRQGQTDTLKNLFWTRLYTNREAEFLDLPEAAAQSRIEEGLTLFKQHGWTPNGFIAPAWLMAPHLPALLHKMGFHYTNRLTELIPLDGRPSIPCQSLCYSTRAAWRRTASLAWNRHLFSRVRHNALMRLSLHPHDLHFETIRQQIAEILKTALHEGFQPTTYAEYAAR
jgi:uncharacterized protein